MMESGTDSAHEKERVVKKFFMVTPQQPHNNLHAQRYVASDNSLLDFKEQTHFPLVPLLSGYANAGEHVQVVTVTYGAPSNCAQNLETLREELAAIERNRNLRIDLVTVDVPFDDSVAALIHTYQILVDHIDDGDSLYACITFGSKPMPLMLTMALQYGYRIRRNVSIECVVYGQMDWSQKPAVARIYDVTALVKLDELVRVLADMRVSEPEAALRMVLNLGEDATPEEDDG